MPTSRIAPNSAVRVGSADGDRTAQQARLSRHGVSRFDIHEGKRVSLALADGSTIDGELVSVGRGRASTIWIFTGEADIFIPFAELIDLWPTASSGEIWADRIPCAS